jgi:hypothetical protein
MNGLHNHFDRRILHGIDYAWDPRPGLELVGNYVYMVADFHAQSHLRFSSPI